MVGAPADGVLGLGHLRSVLGTLATRDVGDLEEQVDARLDSHRDRLVVPDDPAVIVDAAHRILAVARLDVEQVVDRPAGRACRRSRRAAAARTCRTPTAGRRRPRRAGGRCARTTRPCPGSTTPQPNAPSVKRAKSMLERTGSPLPIRVTVAELAERLDDGVGDRLGRAEHVDPRLAGGTAARRASRPGSCRGGRTAPGRRTSRPTRRRASRSPGSSADAMTTRVALLAARGGGEGVDRAGEGERVGAGHVGRAQARRPRHVADADDLGVARRPSRRSGRARASASWLAVRQVGGRSRTGSARRSGRDGEHRRGDPDAPVARVDERHGARARLAPTAPGRRRGRRRPRWRSRRRRRPASCSSSRRPGSRGRLRRRPGAALRADRRLRRAVAAAEAAALAAAGRERRAPDSARTASRIARRRICAGR